MTERKVWHCHWASVADAECIRDDAGEIDAEFVALPNGVILEDIANIDRVFKLVIEGDRELYDDDEYEPDEFVLRQKRSDYLEYGYGDDTLLVCVQKEVL
jgi:hypothetical protein